MCIYIFFLKKKRILKQAVKILNFIVKITFLQEVPHRKDVRKPSKIMLNDMKIHVVHW